MAGFFHLWSKTAADNDDADSTVNWAEGQTAGSVNNSARALMASAASWRDDNNGTLSTAGAANAYTVAAPNIVYAALVNGLTLVVRANHTNTAAATLNVNSLGAKALRGHGDTALGAGQIVSGSNYVLHYNSTANGAAGAWMVIDPTIAGIALSLTTLATSGAATVNSLVVTLGGTIGSDLTISGILSVNSPAFIANGSTGNISCSGNATIGGTLIVKDGTAALPSAGFASDLTTGPYRAANDVYGLAINAIGRFRFDASTFSPVTTSEIALGTTALCFTGLNLDSGGEIVFRNQASAIQGQIGGLAVSLADDASFVLPLTLGYVWFISSDAGRANYALATTVATEVSDVAGTFVATDTDTNHCVFHNGSDFVLRNRRGSTNTYRILYWKYE